MIECYFDGCMEPKNPGGTGAFGAIIFRNGQEIFRASKMFDPKPDRSNNYSEYSGLLCLIEFLLKNDLQKSQIIIHGDSKLIIEQMKGKWRIKQGFYVPIALKCRELMKKFPNTILKWIPREQNFLADELSKKELINAGIEFRIQKVEK